MVRIADMSGFEWDLTNENLAILESAKSDNEFQLRVESYARSFLDDFHVELNFDWTDFRIDLKDGSDAAVVSVIDNVWIGTDMTPRLLMVGLAFLCRLTSELSLRKKQSGLVIEKFIDTYDVKWTLSSEASRAIRAIQSVPETAAAAQQEVAVIAELFSSVAETRISFDWNSLAIMVEDVQMKYCPFSTSWMASGLTGKQTTAILAFLCWLTSFVAGSAV